MTVTFLGVGTGAERAFPFPFVLDNKKGTRGLFRGFVDRFSVPHQHSINRIRAPCRRRDRVVGAP